MKNYSIKIINAIDLRKINLTKIQYELFFIINLHIGVGCTWPTWARAQVKFL